MQIHYNTATSKVNDLFISLLPDTIKCAKDKQYQWARYRKQATALKNYEHIAVNKSGLIHILPVDIDNETYYEDISPAPNIITYNKHNNKSHALYLLDNPIELKNWRTNKTNRYARSIYNGLTEHLGGDHAYNLGFTKNPNSGHFRPFLIHDRLWTIEDFEDYFDPMPEKPKLILAADATNGRNEYLFNTVREWAYKEVRQYKHNQEGFYNAVIAKCEDVNNSFGMPLKDSEIRATARSITGWTHANQNNLGLTGEQGRQVSLEARQMKAAQNMLLAKNMIENLNWSIAKTARELGLGRTIIHKYINSDFK